MADPLASYQLTKQGLAWVDSRKPKLHAAHADCGMGKCASPDAFPPGENTQLQFLIVFSWNSGKPRTVDWVKQQFLDNVAWCENSFKENPDLKGLRSTIDEHGTIAREIHAFISDAVRDGLLRRVL